LLAFVLWFLTAKSEGEFGVFYGGSKVVFWEITIIRFQEGYISEQK